MKMHDQDILRQYGISTLDGSADIKNQLYVGMVVDRTSQGVALTVSSEGGKTIEQVAAQTPEKLHRIHIDPVAGLQAGDAEALARKIGIPEPSVPQACDLLLRLYRAFDESDASLAEINPLALTTDGRLAALDARFIFDAAALGRHPDVVACGDGEEYDGAESGKLHHWLMRQQAFWMVG